MSGGGGDGSEQGTCTNAGEMCLQDGHCKVKTWPLNSIHNINQ